VQPPKSDPRRKKSAVRGYSGGKGKENPFQSQAHDGGVPWGARGTFLSRPKVGGSDQGWFALKLARRDLEKKKFSNIYPRTREEAIRGCGALMPWSLRESPLRFRLSSG